MTETTMWYYNKKGRAYGPVEASVIEGMVKSGELGHLDLLFHEGESEWLPVNSVDQFKGILEGYQLNSKTSDKDVLQNWVILKTVETPEGLQYQQQGPFSEEQVKELVERGAFKFSDYIWKPGFQTWRRIREIPEFSKPLPGAGSVKENTVYSTAPDTTTSTVILDNSQLSELIEIDYGTKLAGNVSTKNADKQELTHPYFDQDETPQEVSTPDMTKDTPLQSRAMPDPKLSQMRVPDQVKKEIKNNQSTAVKKQKTEAKSKATPLPVKPIIPEPPAQKVEAKTVDKTQTPTAVIENQEPVPSMLWYYVAAVILVCTGAMLIFYYSLRNERFNKNKWQASEQVAQAPAPAPIKTPVVTQPTAQAVAKPVPVKPKEEALPQQPAALQVAAQGEPADDSSDVEEEKPEPTPRPGEVSSLKKGKARAYYMSRDRKALMYSSLKASRLASELEKFTKNNRDTSAWKKFYNKWNVEFNTSPSKLISHYKPNRAGDYALPRDMAQFQNEYAELRVKSKEINKQMLNGQKVSIDVRESSRNFYNIYKKLQNL